MTHENDQVRIYVALHEKTTANMLAEMANENDRAVISYVLENPKCPRKTVLSFSNSWYDDVLESVVLSGKLKLAR